MKKLKRLFAFLLTLLLCFSALGIGLETVASAQTKPASDADASTIRVKLSVGDVTAISFTIRGVFSIPSGQLTSGAYTVKNVGGGLNLCDSVGQVLYTTTGSLTVQENENPDAAAYNRTTMKVKGYTRNYLGSMKFFADRQYVDVVNHVYLEKYLYGVVAYEMSNSFPLEALKAQAVAARCYAIKRLEGTRGSTYDIGDTSGDQVYKGYNPGYTNVIKAVDATEGQVLTHNNSIITAYFAASNGGQTDRTENVWSAALPYFNIQNDPYDLANPYSRERTVYFPTGTTADKAEDMASLPLMPSLLGEASGKIYMYARPDTGSSKLASINRGARFFIYERNSAWTKIQYNGKAGFIETKSTKAYNLKASIKSKTKLKASASSKSKTLLVVPKKASVTVLSVGSWYKISYKNAVGYVSKSSLKLTKNSSAKAVALNANSALTVTSTTYLRTAAKSSGKKIMKLSAGARLKLVSSGKSYHKVTYKGKTGYVSAKCTQLVINSLVLTNANIGVASAAVSSNNIRYSQDDMDARLVSFLKTFASQALAAKNASLADGTRYYTTADTIKIKAIQSMTGIQTSTRPYCRCSSPDCPSIDFTGAKMKVLLKVKKQDPSKQGGYNIVDYTWDFQFTIPAYLKSSNYPGWQVFDPGNGLRIYAVEKGADSRGISCFMLINRRFGHGIGLSQRGAQQRAKDPNPAVSRYQSILAFYYPNTVLTGLGYTEAVLPAVPTTLATAASAAILTPTPAPTEPPIATPTPAPVETPVATPTPEPTGTPVVTPAPEPTESPETPAPSETPALTEPVETPVSSETP